MTSAVRSILIILGLILTLAWTGPAGAQGWDHDYEQRAQEVIGGLITLNGLRGWTSNTPDQWPEAPMPPAPGESEAGRLGVYVRWNTKSAPASLATLALVNQGLQRTADFSGLRSLGVLLLHGNSLRGLNLDGLGTLTVLGATKNQLTSLNTRACPNLRHLALATNRLEELDVSGNPRLTDLIVSMNRLTELNLTHNPDLSTLEAGGNRLSRLDLSHNPALTRLMVSYNRLTGLELFGNPLLTELTVRDNDLTQLTVTGLADLRELAAGKNELYELDLRANPRLIKLSVDQNQLTALDLSWNPALEIIEAQNNPLSRLTLGANQLAALKNINLDGCRLSLSQLAPLSGLAQTKARFGTQTEALFEHLSLEQGQPLDLTAEALLGEAATEFILLNDKKRRVKESDYQVEEGLIKIKNPGRYLVQMTNDRVYSSEINNLTGRVRTYKVKVLTGIVEVTPAEAGRPGQGES